MQEKGNISIHTENIFPIIKKFLYSDHEIFLRELVSNAIDATQKLRRLGQLGEFNGDVGETKIVVSFDKEKKTITVSDRGLGMTAEEIKKYINQIAFSGATEFIEKYKDKTDTQQIIGHFGLGFYSAFMVASQVEIQTLSYQANAAPARWICDGSTEFEITEGNRTDRGSDIILHVAEDSEEFLDSYRLKSILTKYCKFLPVEIEFEGSVINNPQPLWTRQPSELTNEDYLSFYKEIYPMAEDPLFWIHLNVDYPFNLTGILYFPKLKKEFEFQRNKIQLYSRQVFITDEVKDVVPEFLMLLHGVIDSPDIPLNVSRSFLQADGNVKKINNHITKKVADKLNELFTQDRSGFEAKWDEIGLFVKYGMISDEKFYDKAQQYCLYKSTQGTYYTLPEYQEKIKTLQTDKDENVVVLYTNNASAQDLFIQKAAQRSYDVLLMDTVLDPHFIGQIEGKHEKLRFKRVDSESLDKLIEKEEPKANLLTKDQETSVVEIFKSIVNDEKQQVKVEQLGSDDLPVSIVLPEFLRRMKDMSAVSGQSMFGGFGDMYEVIVNANHPIIAELSQAAAEQAKAKGRYLYDIALLSQGMLKGSDLSRFIEQSITKA
ncbi:MAG: molecular chaperone HtpG [Cytophagaceae bacterium]|jgi:molecular chaperone HtpG|nr:molecular chaperone HtpG [Cytophagaceae bacterium]